ncbi:Glutathione transporter 1 OS=Schizosaccharomyces pombe (strain 972 / ATCC 24843) GN=pgt1 PE=1 SV=1 [Rhizoctonia solani AG-1 IB]|uniref:Glutathione transporter 1 n=1 Tax=Thanatephorus cucumeris (strain AG1-IB / isolate 7/3/14) TaxID=1108050 RepID=A0A0B7FN13_THACB|nr:Glutathione transporter 1 OS=Schizosaccharomyces pombe (strain 972 / ATCC 24843) GN=pgt1 PE=1 SV=1 [Rhizoctonia solani AG-1 IB]
MDPHPTQQPDERNLTHRIVYQHLNDPNYVIDEHVVRAYPLQQTPTKTDKNSDDGGETDSRYNMEYDIDFEDDSPYPEVRAAVANTDDPTMPTNTFRMWFLGLIFTVLIAGLNQFFSMRYPSVQITALVAQLVALPAGKLLEKTLPRAHITTFGYTWSLNPGPFNIKEHTLITVMANVVAGGAYATDIIAAQRLFYQQYWGATYQLALVVSTQMFGFSLAGICRRFLVWPSSMIWPATLVNTALFNTLHSTYGREEDGRTSRERFFTLAFIGSAAWYFLPGYLFTALSNFTWVCWIAPDNLIVNALFGYQHGLGMGFITFDWAMVAYNSSPLVTPFWAELNVFGALVIVYWIIAPILYYKNVFFSKYLPISSLGAFDRWGDPYKASYVIKDGEFDVEAYKQYSPLYISMTFALSYGLSFGALTSTVVHTWLWYRHDIVRQFRSSMKDETDVHSRLMLAYPEVPQWWYIVLGLISFALGIVTIEVWDTKLPVWAFILSLLISLVYLVPVGMIQAITNQQVGLNVITELIVGYMLPGKPVAMMIFKTFGYITMTQALAFVSDLKLGHYMKVPPRLMYLSQVIASLVSCFVVVGVQAWMFEHIPNLCDINQPNKFTCPGVRVFGTASLIWGGIGPARTFNPGQIFYPLTFCFLIGAVLPIPLYFLARRYPHSWFKYVNMPVVFTGTGNLPPASGINYSSWVMVGFIFQYWIRRRHFGWWSRYNYILSAALDSGVAVGTILIFFCLQYPKNGALELHWWGNTISEHTLDGKGQGHLPLAKGSTFGYETWS